MADRLHQQTVRSIGLRRVMQRLGDFLRVPPLKTPRLGEKPPSLGEKPPSLGEKPPSLGKKTPSLGETRLLTAGNGLCRWITTNLLRVPGVL